MLICSFLDFLSRLASELPDELGSIGSSPPLGLQVQSMAQQNGNDRKNEEMIQKHRNLSELLSSDNVPRQLNPGMPRPPYTMSLPQNARYPIQQQPLRQFTTMGPSASRTAMMPASNMPQCVPGGGVSMSGPRGHVMAQAYQPRHPDFMRASFDNSGRPFANPAASYFMNGPDVRLSAVMNGGPYQRVPGPYTGGMSSMGFPQGSGQFQMTYGTAPAGNGGNVFHGPSSSVSMFSNSMASMEPGRSFPLGNSLSSNSFPTTTSVVTTYGVCVMPNTVVPGSAGGQQQLVNGTHLPVPSSLHMKPSLPVSDLDTPPTNSSASMSPPSAVTLNNCQRMFPTGVSDLGCVVPKTAGGPRPSVPATSSVLSPEVNLVSFELFLRETQARVGSPYCYH